MNLLRLTVRGCDSRSHRGVLSLICKYCQVYILIVLKGCSETRTRHPLLMQMAVLSLAEVRYLCTKHHQSALILHISFIATNNHQCFGKLIKETISFWTEELSSHPSFHRFLRRFLPAPMRPEHSNDTVPS